MELSERLEQPQGRVAIGTMHLAKGLEYKAVAVMACDDDVLPLQERIRVVADELSLMKFTTLSATCSTLPAPVRATGCCFGRSAGIRSFFKLSRQARVTAGIHGAGTPAGG